MRRFLTTLALVVLCLTASAQQVIPLDSSGQSSVAVDDGKLSVNLAGVRLSLAGSEGEQLSSGKSKSSDKKRASFCIAGIDAMEYNHLALVELGQNFLVNTDFAGYDASVQEALGFCNRLSVNHNINLLTLNVALNRRGTLGFTMGFGFSMECYTFADKVSLTYDDGRFGVMPLDQSIRRSKLVVNYIHMPMLFDINMRKHFFISAGASFDVLMSSQLSYRKPRTKVDTTLPLNPVQVGLTARIGWKRVYGYVSYSVLNMYRQTADVRAHRMAAGVGLFF